MHCTTNTKKKTVELSNAEIQAILNKLLKDENSSIRLDNEDLLYRIDVYNVNNVPHEIVFNFIREQRDISISNEEITTLPCGCEVIGKKRDKIGQYCLTSNVELHDKCMILYYNNIGVKQIWWILGKENDS